MAGFYIKAVALHSTHTSIVVAINTIGVLKAWLDSHSPERESLHQYTNICGPWIGQIMPDVGPAQVPDPLPSQTLAVSSACCQSPLYNNEIPCKWFSTEFPESIQLDLNSQFSLYWPCAWVVTELTALLSLSLGFASDLLSAFDASCWLNVVFQSCDLLCMWKYFKFSWHIIMTSLGQASKISPVLKVSCHERLTFSNDICV